MSEQFPERRSASRKAFRSRVCHVISSYHPVIGGAERATRILTRALADQGVSVVVLTRRQPGTDARSEVDGVPVYRAGLARRGKLGALTFGFHGLWLLATALRDCALLHVQNLDTPLLIGIVGRGILGRRLVATIHSEGDIRCKAQTAAGRFRLWAFRRWVDRFTAISPALVQELSTLGIDRTRVSQIPNPVDTDSIQPPTLTKKLARRTELGLPASDSVAVVCFVGRLVPLKQVDLLLRAYRAVADVHRARLVVAGDGPELPRLQVLAADLGLAEQVLFTGMLADVRPVLEATDVFVLPSSKEGLSMALLEAQATGLACVVSDLPGNRAVVADGMTGMIVPPGDVASLARAISLLVVDPARRTALGNEARRSLGSGYSSRRVAQQHRAVYSEVVSQHTALPTLPGQERDS